MCKCCLAAYEPDFFDLDDEVGFPRFSVWPRGGSAPPPSSAPGPAAPPLIYLYLGRGKKKYSVFLLRWEGFTSAAWEPPWLLAAARLRRLRRTVEPTGLRQVPDCGEGFNFAEEHGSQNVINREHAAGAVYELQRNSEYFSPSINSKSMLCYFLFHCCL